MIKKKMLMCWLPVLLFLVSMDSNAQRQLVDGRKLDTAEVLASKKMLNGLDTDSFKKRQYTDARGTIPYRFLSPRQIVPGKKYPLVITFHNSSRIGTDNESQLEPLARIWIREEIYRDYNCFVIAPQFSRRSSDYLQGSGGILTSAPSQDVEAILKLIAQTQRNYPVDRRRIYLVGYSMGASTAQNLFSMKPDKFTALVSIAGVPDLSHPDEIRKKKIWLIHGKQDTDNPYSGSGRLYETLKGNRQLTFTTFTHLEHNNIMVPYLLTDEIPRWLFNPSRRPQAGF